MNGDAPQRNGTAWKRPVTEKHSHAQKMHRNVEAWKTQTVKTGRSNYAEQIEQKQEGIRV